MKLLKSTLLLALSAGAIVSAAATPQRAAFATPEFRPKTADAVLSSIRGSRSDASIRQIPISDIEGRNLTLILKEDFSKMTEGTEDKPTDWTVNDRNAKCDDAFFNTPGWTGQGVFSAGGCVGLTYPGVGGTLNTPEGNYAGKIIVKFRAKAFNKDTNFFVSICKGGFMNPSRADGSQSEMPPTLKTSEGWKDYIFEITSFSSDLDSFLNINAVCYRDGILVDDLEIYRDEDFIYTPQKLKGSGYKADGFTASWDPVQGADSYVVSLIEENILGTKNVAETADFNSIDTSKAVLDSKDIPEGWDIHLTSADQVTADGGADGTPAIKLSGNDEYVQLPMNGGAFQSFSYFLKPSDKEAVNGYFHIEVLNPATGSWEQWGYMANGAFPREGQTISLKDFEDQYPKTYAFKGKFTGVRVHASGLPEGTSMIIDNIKYECAPASERKTVVEEKVITEPQIEFTGLNPEAEHYFQVWAKKGDKVSEVSPLVHAFGISNPVVQEASDVDRRGGFTANWERTPKANRYDVALYKVDKAAADNDKAEILATGFDDVVSDTGTQANPEEIGNYYEVIPLSDFGAPEGWEGQGNIRINGMIGCGEDQIKQFTLFSPYMSLQNNGGKFSVTLSVASVPGAYFIVQNNDTEYVQIPVEEQGLKEYTINFTSGTYYDRLMLYTISGEPFLLDEILVNQNLKEGDYLFSRLENVDETATSHRFTVDNTACDLFAYNVTAYHTAFAKTCHSEISDMAFVSYGTGVEEVEGNAAVAVRGLAGALEIDLAAPAAIEVYDLTGRRVISAEGAEGRNSIAAEAGFYVVKIGKKAFKTIVK